MNSPFSCYFLDLRISFPGLRSRMFWGKGKYILLRFTKYSLQQTNNKWNSSPIDCPHKVQNLSSLGILYHRPISISKYIAHVFMKLHLCTSQVTCMRVNKILGLRNTQPRLKIFETNLHNPWFHWIEVDKYSLQQTNNKWNSSPIDCPHKVQNLSSLGILYPVSISKCIVLQVN
jgi:hypothetical protein